jgi:peptidoglycan hydrolase-like protein with peptidoglycan-binding domain
MKKVIAITAIVFVSFVGIHSAHAMISSQLDLGSTGSDVTELQTYLSSSPNLYPAKLVTGFFGPLTQAGVQMFQTEQNIVSSGSPETTGYGRVGPMTILRLNALNGASQPLTSNQAPIISVITVNSGQTSATLSWITSSQTRGQVFYDTASLIYNEATGPQQQPYVSGAWVYENSASFSHTITLVNLRANTTYHFLVRSTDVQGNMTMIPQESFTTKN